MDPLVREAALRAALKVTLFVSLAACGSTVEVATDGTNDPTPGDDDHPPWKSTPNDDEPDGDGPRPPADDPPEPALACDAPLPGTEVGTVDQETFECCVSLLEPLFVITPRWASSDAAYCARAASFSRRMRPQTSSSHPRLKPACA